MAAHLLCINKTVILSAYEVLNLSIVSRLSYIVFN